MVGEALAAFAVDDAAVGVTVLDSVGVRDGVALAVFAVGAAVGFAVVRAIVGEAVFVGSRLRSRPPASPTCEVPSAMAVASQKYFMWLVPCLYVYDVCWWYL